MNWTEVDRVFVDRPDFDNYFMGLAFAISKRSMDAQTHHGTLLVDSNKHIVATGYNSFPRGMPDAEMPNLRPAKYKWMDHSEQAAVANLILSPWQAQDITAYITGTPCFSCSKTLWRHGIKNWVLAERQGTQLEVEDAEELEYFLSHTKPNIRVIRPNLNWLKGLVLDLQKIGFID